MIFLIIFFSILTSLFILFFLFLFIIYLYTFHTPRKGQNDEFALTKTTVRLCDSDYVKSLISRLVSIPYEDVYISSYDKKRLHAKVYENKKSNVVILMLHGYRGTARRDFSGGAYEMISKGYNVVLIDHRGHDKSSGHNITFGVKEKLDVKSWIKYIKSRFGSDKKIVLVGISMGGATALFSSDLLSKDDRLIVDCPYTSTKEVLTNYLSTTFKKMNTKFLYFLVNLSSIIFNHVNMSKENTDTHIDKCPCPILIIHGSGDTLVPYRFSYRLKEKYPHIVRYELFDGVEHGLCYISSRDKYVEILNDFLKGVDK